MRSLAAKSELEPVEILWKTICKIMKEWDLCPVNSGCKGTTDGIFYGRGLTPQKRLRPWLGRITGRNKAGMQSIIHGKISRLRRILGNFSCPAAPCVSEKKITRVKQSIKDFFIESIAETFPVSYPYKILRSARSVLFSPRPALTQFLNPSDIG